MVFESCTALFISVESCYCFTQENRTYVTTFLGKTSQPVIVDFRLKLSTAFAPALVHVNVPLKLCTRPEIHRLSSLAGAVSWLTIGTC